VSTQSEPAAADTGHRPPRPRPEPAADGVFAEIYRANVSAITGYFARRCADPQAVADLTSETFVQAIGSFHTFDPRRGSSRGWLFGIARIVFAHHREAVAAGQAITDRLGGQRSLEDDEIDELAARIDAQREGRELLDRWTVLPELDRSAIELVDLAGLTPKQAAVSLGVQPAAMRARLFRARARLRKEPKRQ
jgi:RNA polymerase sigma factor (sigma-70 family)